MTTVQHAPAYLRKRKMLLVLPMMVLPFLTMGFWALSGGKNSGATQITQAHKGLNLELPGAHLKADDNLDKLSYYEMASDDSAKLKEHMRSDPYFKLKTNISPDSNGVPNAGEAKVYEKLHAINVALTSAKDSCEMNHDNLSPKTKFDRVYIPAEPTVNKQNVDHLEKMMATMKQDNGGDEEMNQINGMLEKIVNIQHPELLNEKLAAHAAMQKSSVYSVVPNNERSNGFYDADGLDSNSQLFNSIEAVVHETQTLVNGGTVKLRLCADVTINGIQIPKDNFVFGKASLSGERLTVAVSGIRYQNSLLPVALAVCDLDGMDGIYIPGAISRDVAKQSTDNALQSVALNSLDPSIGAQAASAGIETAKTFISKKVKLVRVTVKAGYRVLLRDNTAITK